MMRLETGPREVTAYHGCTGEVAERLIAGEPWLPSQNRYDWLGEGIYFWEYAPHRAMEWAKERYGSEAAVIRARIRLGRCANLLDTRHFVAMKDVFNETMQAWIDQGVAIPANTPRGGHFLDCHIIDTYCRRVGKTRRGDWVQTVRSCFPEGEPIYSGSKILTKAHVQISVRDTACILRIERVQS